MKKILFVCSLAFLCLTATSQKVYVLGGVNLANISKDKNGNTSESNMLTTFNGGVLARFGVSEVFDIESGLMLNGKGSKHDTYVTSSRDDNYVKTKFNPYYMELPLNAVIKLPTESNNFFLHAGPYGAMGIFGKSKVESRFLGVTTESEKKIEFNNDNITTSEQEGASYSKLKRFDYGLNFGAGATLAGVMVRANYGLGLAKINSMQTNNSKDQANKHRVINISVGIPIGGGSK